MQKRSLGRCGLVAGELGLGCEGLIGKPEKMYQQALDMMEEAGANAIDLYSPNPEMRDCLGRALAGRRGAFLLQGHICTVWRDGQYKRTREMGEVRRGFEDQLERLGTDHLEIGMIHYVDALDDWGSVLHGPVMRYASDLKKGGVISAIGLSTHNPQVGLAAVESGLVDVILFAVNPCYDLQPASEDVEQLWNREKYSAPLLNMDPERAAFYQACQAAGVGITVMKAFGGGDLLHADRSLAGIALSVPQCIAYALDRPGVACVFAGAHSTVELAQCLAYAETGPAERDYAATLASFPRISWRGHCMYCGHCAPCPAGIDIAQLTRLLNLALASKGAELPETLREHYAALKHRAHECRQCKVCESRCPFGVGVRANMLKAAQIFGAQ